MTSFGEGQACSLVHSPRQPRGTIHRSGAGRTIGPCVRILLGVTTFRDDRPFRGHSHSRRWERVSYGLYAPARARTLREELTAWQLVLPATAGFTHLTAAELFGWWLPAAIPHPVFAATCGTDLRRRRPGLLLCRHPKPVALRVVDGLRVTTPAETLLAAARDLGALDLVVMADSALRVEHLTLAELKMAAGQHRRGAPLLRSVIPMLDPRSESAWESILRVLHRAADIPVLVQQDIRTESGQFLGRADLLIEGTRRLQEYDGAGHRDADAQANFLARERGLLADGWQRNGYVSRDLLTGAAGIVASVDATLSRDWDGRRLHAWQQLIRHSLYGRAGRARAYQQWRRAALPLK